MQRKIALYLQDLKSNEHRLMELNALAEKLHAAGHPEAAKKIRDQIAVSLQNYFCMNDSGVKINIIFHLIRLL